MTTADYKAAAAELREFNQEMWTLWFYRWWTDKAVWIVPEYLRHGS